MEREKKMIEQKRLFEMLCAGVTPFACVQECERRLSENGFENIDYEDYISCIKITAKDISKLRHKDFMGSIYSLGIKTSITFPISIPI